MESEPSKEDLAQFREWLEKMPHLVQDYDDEFLAAFIRSRKGSLQKAKERLESFNSLGMKYPEICGSLDPFHPQLQEHLSEVVIFPLPKKTEDDCTVIFIGKNPKHQDPNKIHIPEIFRYYLLSIYVLLWEQDFGSGKWKLICDWKNCTLEDVKGVTPMSAKQMMSVLTSGFPISFKSSVVLNLPSSIEWVMNLFKMLLKKKLSDRIYYVSGFDDLSKYFPRKMLPREYGGSEDSILVLHENWKKKVESYRERFVEEEQKMRRLDSLRPKIDDGDEMTGTFRQLNVD